MSGNQNRRDFLKTSAAAGAAGVGYWVAGGVSVAQSKSPNERLACAAIGAGGKGHSDIKHMFQAGEDVVALCDVDLGRAQGTDNDLKKTAEQAGRKHESAKLFQDFREMLEKMGDKIDAVNVSTPDHNHAVATAAAIRKGIHTYVQKPLTHTVHEARVLRKLAKEKGVQTQMGNQGTALDSLRTGVELVQSGAIGDVQEVHVWTNRPVWPQGEEAVKQVEQGKGKPKPYNLDWDMWLGPAAWREYNPAYLPFKWRGFWDFGTGALGDMACHTMNLPFWALSLEYPTSVHAEVPQVFDITPPWWSVITFEFPARTVVATGQKLPPVKLVWYDGNTRQGHLPKEKRHFGEVARKYGVDDADSNGKTGSFFVGSKGALYAPGDYGQSINLLPGSQYPGGTGKYAPKPWIARRPGEGGNDFQQKKEWIEAIKGGPAPMSNFEYAAYFTEIILLGNLAMRVPGKKIQWDGPAMKSPNVDEANKYVSHEYRDGFKLM